MTPVQHPPSDWLGHGFTAKLRRSLEEQLENAFRNLIADSKASTDPKVTKRVAEYEQMRSFLEQLRAETSDGRPDGDD